MRFPRFLILAAVLAVFASTGGCDDFFDRPPLERDFGTAYDLLFNQPSADDAQGRITPFIDEDGLLRVFVRFAGGCVEHRFRPDFLLTEESASVWLIHADNGDNCGGENIEEISISLPPLVLERSQIFLIGPSGDEREVPRFFDEDEEEEGPPTP